VSFQQLKVVSFYFKITIYIKRMWSLFNISHGDLGTEITVLFNMNCLPLSATLKMYPLVIKID